MKVNSVFFMIWFLMISIFVPTLTQASEGVIGLWRETPGMTQSKAYELTIKGIKEFLAVDEDGVNCGVDEIWSVTMEQPLKPDRPERGDIFAVTAYASGPYKGCSETHDYDCRVIFNRPPGALDWAIEYTECVPLKPIED